MNKHIQKAIEELEHAIECDNPYIYSEAINNYAMPILKDLLMASAMTVEEIINKFVTPSSHRKIVKGVE